MIRIPKQAPSEGLWRQVEDETMTFRILSRFSIHWTVKNYAIPMAVWQGRQEPESEHLISAIPIAMRLQAVL